LQVKTTTSTRAPAKDASDQVFPSTPGKEKSGAADPIGNVGCSSAGRTDLSTGRTGPEKHRKLKAIRKSFMRHILPKLPNLPAPFAAESLHSGS
jgi:hypothetical protein